MKVEGGRGVRGYSSGAACSGGGGEGEGLEKEARRRFRVWARDCQMVHGLLVSFFIPWKPLQNLFGRVDAKLCLSVHKNA